jgi:hypothetical protein
LSGAADDRHGGGGGRLGVLALVRDQLLARFFTVQMGYSSRDAVTRVRRRDSVHAILSAFSPFAFLSVSSARVTGSHDPRTTDDRVHRDPTRQRPDRYFPDIISNPTQHAPQLGGQQDMRGVHEPARFRRRRSRCVTAGSCGGGAAREHVVLRRVHLSQRHVLVPLRHMHAGESVSRNPRPNAAPNPSHHRRRAVSPRDDTRAGISESLHPSRTTHNLTLSPVPTHHRARDRST